MNASTTDGKITAFTQAQEARVQGLASYAAIALEAWMQLDRVATTVNHLRSQLQAFAHQDSDPAPDHSASLNDSLKLVDYLLQQINFQTS